MHAEEARRGGKKSDEVEPLVTFRGEHVGSLTAWRENRIHSAYITIRKQSMAKRRNIVGYQQYYIAYTNLVRQVHDTLQT